MHITTRDTDGQIQADTVRVKSYGDIAGQYAYRPETKFADANGNRCNRTTTGTLHRRHITGGRSEYLGKEGTPPPPPQ